MTISAPLYRLVTPEGDVYSAQTASDARETFYEVFDGEAPGYRTQKWDADRGTWKDVNIDTE